VTAVPRRSNAPATDARGAPPLWPFGLLSFMYFAGIGLFNPYAPLWFQQLGFSTIVIGGIASLMAWTRVLSPYAWGWLGDHRGRRVGLIRVAALGAVASAAGLLGVREAFAVSAVTMALFLFNGGVVPLSEATLAHLLATRDGFDSARYGRVRVWGSIGFIVSVSAFGVILQRLGIGTFPAFVVIVNALMLAAALRLPALHAEPQHDEPAPAALARLRDPAVAWFFASAFFTVLAHSSLYAFFSIYLVALGYSKTAVGMLWAVSTSLEIVFFAFQGRWTAAWAPHVWLQVVASVTVLRFAATAAGGAWVWVLVLAQATHAVTFAAHHATCIRLVHEYFPGRLRGRGQALYTTLGYGISGVIGGVGGGWLIERLGHASVFWAAAGAGVLAWACVRKAAAAHAGRARPGP
jgi:PPP family 3-phenylpropionic acid transporter